MSTEDGQSLMRTRTVPDYFNSPAFKRQQAEFQAAAELSRLWRSQPAIVDDDYPSWRRDYERAATRFCEARTTNTGEKS